ncbi:MAG TPA: DUF4124 domain-containing protein [Rhodanobacteraceae bacterium]|nr:DUF4124 domain-containing protein [Rhodanobacteraceae bacterium]
MDHPTQPPRSLFRHRALLAHAACAGLLLLATGAHAASIYKCVAADGRLAFRDTPCAADARQTKLNVSGLPLMDPGAPRHAAASRTTRSSAHRRTRRRSARKRPRKQPMSWECRATDGEVFYRHTGCPGSVPGDGVVRWQDGGDSSSGKRSRRRRNAWGSVSVRGVEIPRAEACRRIHSAGAAVRDGHRRDAHVSTYDHLMGRDPCSGF